MWQQLLQDLARGNVKALARVISLVENEHDGYEDALQKLAPNDAAKIIGVTGPPGAGKSTLVDALIGEAINDNKKVAVLCVDPSSPFNLGAVLGDRIRMSGWYTHPNVFIRSLATRGSMGGLHPKIIEITDVIKAAAYDYIIVETVGVGQSEIEIAGLADATVVVLVPEAGDEVQTMKAGLMEIADVFVVNKSDRPDADAFVKNLRLMLAPAFRQHKAEIQIVKTVASAGTGIPDLYKAIQTQLAQNATNEKKAWLLAERAYHLLQQNRMRGIERSRLRQRIEALLPTGLFNLYRFVYGLEEEV
jgi:LAO/AO transport system kinase